MSARLAAWRSFLFGMLDHSCVCVFLLYACMLSCECFAASLAQDLDIRHTRSLWRLAAPHPWCPSFSSVPPRQLTMRPRSLLARCPHLFGARPKKVPRHRIDDHWNTLLIYLFLRATIIIFFNPSRGVWCSIFIYFHPITSSWPQSRVSISSAPGLHPLLFATSRGVWCSYLRCLSTPYVEWDM